MVVIILVVYIKEGKKKRGKKRSPFIRPDEKKAQFSIKSTFTSSLRVIDIKCGIVSRQYIRSFSGHFPWRLKIDRKFPDIQCLEAHWWDTLLGALGWRLFVCELCCVGCWIQWFGWKGGNRFCLYSQLEPRRDETSFPVQSFLWSEVGKWLCGWVGSCPGAVNLKAPLKGT